MAKVILIYDSSRAESLAGMAIAYTEYNNADNTVTLKDTKALDLSTLNTWVGTLSAAAYDKIYSYINTTRVEEVLATAVITITEGIANEVGFLIVDDGTDVITIGSVTSDASGSYHDAIALAASVNDGGHGYTATRVDDVLTISAPVGSGVGGDAYAATSDVTHGGTLDIAITTDFSVTSTGVSAVGVSGDISEAYFIDLEAKIIADPVATGTSTAGGVATVTLAAGSSAVDDYYKGMFVLLLTNTGADQVRMITGYVGSTLVATVDYNWGTQPDGTTTYAISQDLCAYGRIMDSKSQVLRAWEKIHPGITAAKVVQYLGIYTYPKNGGKATSGGASTLSDTNHNYFEYSVTFGSALFANYYVGIVSGTGAGQVRKISTNTANQLTVSRAWATNPDATSVYEICQFEADLFIDTYLKKYIATYLYDFTGVVAAQGFQRLYDKGKYDHGIKPKPSDIAAGANITPYQDTDFLYGDVYKEGKAIFYNSIL